MYTAVVTMVTDVYSCNNYGNRCIEIHILRNVCRISYGKRPRRQDRFFKPIDFRLKISEHNLPFAGTKLYNLTCNLINASTE